MSWQVLLAKQVNIENAEGDESVESTKRLKMYKLAQNKNSEWMR